MLTLNGVDICLQNFGSVLAVFLRGESREEIERRHWSFYNHEATRGELDWWSDRCAMFWIYSTTEISAIDKFKRALVRAAFCELVQAGSKGTNPWGHAYVLGEKRFATIEYVTWYKITKVWEMFDLGSSVSAEKGTGNFDDDVLAPVVNEGKERLEAVQSQFLQFREATLQLTEVAREVALESEAKALYAFEEKDPVKDV